MKPVPGLGLKWPTGKTCVAERPAKRVASNWLVEKTEGFGSLKCEM
jgi:hypothetical protein